MLLRSWNFRDLCTSCGDVERSCPGLSEEAFRSLAFGFGGLGLVKQSVQNLHDSQQRDVTVSHRGRAHI